VCLMFIIFQNQYVALIAGAFFVIVYGVYTSVDVALTDVLAHVKERVQEDGLLGDVEE